MVSVSRSTPVLIVEQIEPSLAFWRRLGFEVTVQVPHAESTGFAILQQGNVELMLQCRASLLDDVPAAAGCGEHVLLFVEVASLDAALAALGEVDVFLPRRQTFYGATEVGVVEPGGHRVTLAEFTRQAA